MLLPCAVPLLLSAIASVAMCDVTADVALVTIATEGRVVVAVVIGARSACAKALVGWEGGGLSGAGGGAGSGSRLGAMALKLG